MTDKSSLMGKAKRLARDAARTVIDTAVGIAPHEKIDPKHEKFKMEEFKARRRRGGLGGPRREEIAKLEED